MIVLTFIACLGGHCEAVSQAWRTVGIGEARACRAAYDFARARLPEGVTVREVECALRLIKQGFAAHAEAVLNETLDMMKENGK